MPGPFQILTTYWRQLKNGKPGRRFRAFYRHRQERRTSSSSWSRGLVVTMSTVLIVIGLGIGWLPGPGGVLAIIGVALLAAESRWLAGVLDWGERRAWAIWHRLTTSAPTRRGGKGDD